MKRLGIASLTTLVVVAAALLAYLPASASAVLLHPVQSAKFGVNGTSATSFSFLSRIGYDQTRQRLLVIDSTCNCGTAKGQIRDYDNSTLGTYAQLTSSNGFPNFPISSAPPIGDLPGYTNSGDVAVDNGSVPGSNGNFYSAINGYGLVAWSNSGGFLWNNAANGGCGVGVDGGGNIWVSKFISGKAQIIEVPSSGTAPIGSVDYPPGTLGCGRVAFDTSNNDMYVTAGDIGQNNSHVYRLTAASNYTTSILISSADARDITIDPTTHNVYLLHFTNVSEYDNNGNLIEVFANPNSSRSYNGIAGDWARGVVFVSDGNEANDTDKGKILVYPAIIVPDLTTSDPTEFATLHGNVDPAGGGDVTECHFQWGTGTTYSNGGTKPCSPAIPPNYTGPTAVSADLTGSAGFNPEQLYHYRLVASNAKATNFSADASFTPHYVAGLKTDPATAVTRNGATLNADYFGTNDDTHYYFEWGTKPGVFTSQSTLPPGVDDGAQTGARALSFTSSSGFAAGTTYYYRVVASNTAGNAAGKLSFGNQVSFTTPPAVTGLSTDPPDPILNDGAHLNGTFTGEGIDTKYHFEYGSTTFYGSTTPVVDLPSPNGATAISADITGLQPRHVYHARVIATNSFGTTIGNDQTFTTTSPPVIVVSSTSNPTATSIDLHAVINPEGFDTDYHFAYGHSTTYGSQVPDPDVTIPAGFSNVPVTFHLTGLDGGVYHFKVVASSIKGVTETIDQSFNFYPPVCPNEHLRQQSDSDTLPDCRAYELVSPEDAGNAVIYGSSEPFSPFATTPSRLAFEGAFGTIPGVGNPPNVASDLYAATRTDNGWQTKYIGLPADVAETMGGPPWALNGSLFQTDAQQDVLTNPSMSRIVDWNRGAWPCPPSTGFGADCYSLGNGGEPGGGVNASNAPYVWDTTTGHLVDRWPTNVGAVPNGVYFKGRTEASFDLTHFIFTSDIPFLPGGLPNDPAPSLAGDVYDNDTVHGTLAIASLDSSSARVSAAPVRASRDGSHILMTVGGGRFPGSVGLTGGPGVLYMRVDDAVSYDVSLGHAVALAGLTPDGSKVYFTTAEDLTPDHSDLDTSVDLYMWSEVSASPNHLTLISKGNDPTTGNTDSCAASWTSKCSVAQIWFSNRFRENFGLFSNPLYQGAPAGLGGSDLTENFIAPENGDIYFLSPEQLDGSNGVKNQVNLYDFRGGKLQFVTALTPGSRSCIPNLDGWCSRTPIARIETTPNDSKMAFVTSSQVTSYDNAGHAEMYTYAPATGELLCVSCLPSGDPPTSEVTASHSGRFITDDGRVFFDTKGPLVPADTNQTTDTYEYAEGRPQLISSGTAPGAEGSGLTTALAIPGLIGVSADGTDVYFATRDSLVGQDRNGDAIKIYDARSGGGFPFVAPPPACAAADECHGPGSAGPAGLPSGAHSDLGSKGNVPAVQKAHRRHRRHSRHRRSHHRGRRHG
jgi:hypothetical protein